MTEQIQAESNASDEIDLRELLRSVLATRVPVVISLLVVSIVFWVAQIALNFVNPEVYRYDSRIDFIFDGVQEGRIPTGLRLRCLIYWHPLYSTPFTMLMK